LKNCDKPALPDTIHALGECMDAHKILAELRSERSRIDQAISALESLDGNRPARVTGARIPKRRRHRMTAAGRKKLSDMMKARWARRRKAKAPARHMSAASRRRISQMMKKRWAERKKRKAA
jgi:hypothetical protein